MADGQVAGEQLRGNEAGLTGRDAQWLCRFGAEGVLEPGDAMFGQGEAATGVGLRDSVCKSRACACFVSPANQVGG